MPKRLKLLDGIRGILMINAMLYHALWDLVYIYGLRLGWYRSTAVHIWQQCICCGFILLSGICWRLSKSVWRHLKNGAVNFACGGLVTLVTVIVIPESAVVCGIITFMGSCMLLLIPLDKMLEKIPCAVGAAVSLMLFIVFRSVNEGTLLFGAVKLPLWLYRGDIMTFIGFMEPGFYSSDYFSLLPWLFLYLTGYFISPAVRAADSRITDISVPVADFIGRHSLIFYLAHQPVFYFLFRCMFL